MIPTETIKQFLDECEASPKSLDDLNIKRNKLIALCREFQAAIEKEMRMTIQSDTFTCVRLGNSLSRAAEIVGKDD